MVTSQPLMLSEGLEFRPDVIFEVSGKLTVTSIELGAEASAATRLDLGVVRPPGGSPSVVNTMGEVTTTWKPRVDGPSWTDVRLAPSLEMFGAADLLIGPPYLEALQLNLWVRTAPRGTDEFHWHLDIAPRLSVRAGFELGTGVDIDSYSPERAAADLRDAIPA